MKLYFFLFFCLFLSYHACAQVSDRYAPLPDWYHDYDVKFYKIDISANDTSTNIIGHAEISAEIINPRMQQFTLELAEDIHVDSVLIDGSNMLFKREKDNLHIQSPKPFAKGEIKRITVYYAAVDIKDSGFFSAVRSQVDSKWNIPVTWTLSEPFNAKKWFPCKQYLPDKADSAHVFITVPNHLKAGAPGILTAVTPVGEDKSRYEWKTRYPVAYYLLSFAVSEYQDYTYQVQPEGLSEPFPVQNYIYDRDGYLEANKAAIDTTGALINLFSELFIPYPFSDEKYGHCAAPMGGGMEHQTMTTISDFDFLLIAHELAHQWFGDLVTCSSFQDIWINEGFASYSEYLALEYLASKEEAVSWMKKTHSMATWSQTGSVFVPKESADDTWRIFSMSLSYKKGAALVHNIRYIVNDDDKFFEILRGFLRKYSFSTASGPDFKKYIEDETGMDFTLFFDQWYFGEGFPIFDISWEKTGENIRVLVEHKGSAAATPLFNFDMDIQLIHDDGSSDLFKIPVRSNRDIFEFSTGKDITDIEIDPGYYILKNILSNALVKDLPTNDNFVRCETRIKRRQNLLLEFADETARDCTVKLTDTMNEKVITEINAKRKKSLEIPMTDIPNGTYLLYVENGKETYVRKITKSTY